MKFTPERLERFAQAIELGSTIGHACAYAGFSERRYYEWAKDARENPDSLYKELLTIQKEAEARGMMANLARIQRAAKEGTWQASAWILERRYPEHYGRRTIDHNARVQMQVENAGDLIRAAVREMSDEELGVCDD